MYEIRPKANCGRRVCVKKRDPVVVVGSQLTTNLLGENPERSASYHIDINHASMRPNRLAKLRN